jgi:hypothetical protein
MFQHNNVILDQQKHIGQTINLYILHLNYQITLENLIYRIIKHNFTCLFQLCQCNYYKD